MNAYSQRRAVFCGSIAAFFVQFATASACAPCWHDSGKPVVNADQTVILIWDPATKAEHFIRKATFKSDADNFGFLVPSPTQPELAESGNEAFPFLQKLTEPELITRFKPIHMSCGCAKEKSDTDAPVSVRVLEEKDVAGFHAVVLDADSSNALIEWLKAYGYAFSPEIAAWAKPYIDGGWKITALRVAKNKDEAENRSVSAGALRMSFHTDKPLFPYREPDFKDAADRLGARSRLLRIYFISDARYGGAMEDSLWTGKVAWANQVSAEDRKKTLDLLKLPETAGPASWFMTEFEDAWQYRIAAGDVYFAKSNSQDTLTRPPIIHYVIPPWPTDITFYAIVAVIVGPVIYSRWRRRKRRHST